MSKNVTQKRGVPALARDPIRAFRASDDFMLKIEAWARRQSGPKLTSAAAIRRLLETALEGEVASLDQQIAKHEEKISRSIPESRSPARGMAQMRKGHAENEVRKLVAKKRKAAD